MKKNNKGFTLIELLAVVVIMLAISVMAVSSISAAIKRNNRKQDETKIKVLESYAELYAQQNKNTVGNKIKISQLETAFKLSEEELTNSDGDLFIGVLCKIGDSEKWEWKDKASTC